MIKYSTEVVTITYKQKTLWHVVIRKTYNVDTDDVFSLGPYASKGVAQLVEAAFIEPLQVAEDHTMLSEDFNE